MTFCREAIFQIRRKLLMTCRDFEDPISPISEICDIIYNSCNESEDGFFFFFLYHTVTQLLLDLT